MTMRKLAPIAAALTLATPAAAFAQSATAGQTWQVGNSSYHLYLTDLDLSTAAGRGEALARVERVAAKLCAKGVRAERRRCVAEVTRTSTTGSAQDALRLALDERAATWRTAAASK